VIASDIRTLPTQPDPAPPLPAAAARPGTIRPGRTARSRAGYPNPDALARRASPPAATPRPAAQRVPELSSPVKQGADLLTRPQPGTTQGL